MIKIIGRSYLQDYWQRHPESEEILKAWFYSFQSSSHKSKEKIIKDLPSTRTLIFNLSSFIFLLADFHEQLEVLKIRTIGTFHKAGSYKFLP